MRFNVSERWCHFTMIFIVTLRRPASVTDVWLCFSCRQFQLQQNRPAQSYSNVSDCSAVCRCAGSLPSVVLQLTVKLTIKVNMYLWTEALSACSCGIKCSEMFKDLNVCVCQMSLVDLGKRLLEAARKGQDDEVRNLMANGAPFTTDWVRLAAVWSDSSVRVTAGSTWFNVLYSLTWENPRCCSPSQSVQSKHTHITTVPSEPQQPVFMLVMVFLLHADILSETKQKLWEWSLCSSPHTHKQKYTKKQNKRDIWERNWICLTLTETRPQPSPWGSRSSCGCI